MSFDLRPLHDEDVPQVVAIINAQLPEPLTLTEYQHQRQHADEAGPYLRLVAVDTAGRVLGFGNLGVYLMDRRPGYFAIGVRVDRAQRGRGIARALYGALAAWATANGAVRLHTGVREEETAALAWAERLGYLKRHHLFESSLNLQAWDPTPYLGVVEQARKSGIRFTTVAAENIHDPATRQRYYELDMQAFVDDPSHAGAAAQTYAEWERLRLQDPRLDLSSAFVAMDGAQWVAIAHLIPLPSGAVWHGGTGVDRAYRGRDLALATKVVALSWAKAQGIPEARTGNASDNHAMLAVNRKLGYLPRPGRFSLTKDL